MNEKSISTKKGDQGTTGLLNGQRIKKYSLRPETYGTIDEAASFIGLARAKSENEDLQHRLIMIQRHLYLINAELACPSPCGQLEKKIEQGDLEKIEKLESEIELELEFPKKFVLYGERMVSAHLDVARAVIRRAERRLVELSDCETIRPLVLKYINRLSDVLYLLARYDEFSNNCEYRFAAEE
ncbi:MAG: cob(I)yrinic acid a,c-diamide adenosyltransferase [Spirochaetales bacterium]|nr:cob(I)yrinic acid a,c-diamide adenosyltransferase [Spirochaetales bacterium]